MALFPPGRQKGIWLSNTCCHCQHGSSTLCCSLRRCCPEHGTKVDMTVEVIDSIQESKIPIYILMDSWYTNADVWNKCMEKKCHLIGAMKTNRILYPNGVRTSANDYASILTQDQFHLVTVSGLSLSCHDQIPVNGS